MFRASLRSRRAVKVSCEKFFESACWGSRAFLPGGRSSASEVHGVAARPCPASWSHAGLGDFFHIVKGVSDIANVA